jgi:hypothetical protein
MKKVKLTQNDMIKEVMNNFDFERVQHAMDLMNWTWYNTKKAPSIDELKKAARHHLDRVIQQALSPDNTESHHVSWMSASGGFVARAWKTKKNNLSRLTLDFVLTSWESDRYNG